MRVAVAAVDVDTRELDFRLVGRAGGAEESRRQSPRQIARQTRRETAKRPQKEKPPRQKRTPAKRANYPVDAAARAPLPSDLRHEKKSMIATAHRRAYSNRSSPCVRKELG